MIRQWVIAGFLSLVTVFAVVDFYEEVIMYNPMKDMDERIGRDKEGRHEVPSAISGGWGKEIYELNLFSPLRTYIEPRPVIPEVIKLQEPPPKRPVVRLKGIILNEFNEYVAFVEKDGAKAVNLRKGDTYDDIVVIDIAEKRADFKWMDETITLTMEKVKTIRK